MLLRLDTADDQPIYRQIAAAVRRAIREEEVSEGDRLPAARDLASSLGVNMHTVLRAYSLLRDEGVVELRPGRGATVVGDPDDATVGRMISELAREARRRGVPIGDLVDALQKEYE